MPPGQCQHWIIIPFLVPELYLSAHNLVTCTCILWARVYIPASLLLSLASDKVTRISEPISRITAHVSGEKNAFCSQPLITYVVTTTIFAWSNNCRLVCCLCFIIMDSMIIRQNYDSETKGTVQCKPTTCFQPKIIVVKTGWHVRGRSLKKKKERKEINYKESQKTSLSHLC